jgi:hypothetical protein
VPLLADVKVASLRAAADMAFRPVRYRELMEERRQAAELLRVAAEAAGSAASCCQVRRRAIADMPDGESLRTDGSRWPQPLTK